MTTTEEAAPATTSPGAYSHRQILVIMSGLMLGMLLAALDQTIVTTALTTISRDFHRLDLYGWVVTSYLLTSTATTPLYGKISDQFGRKRIFQLAIVIFLAGSALSGFSQNMYQLIAFRGVQGIGAGGLMSLAMAIVGDVIPPRERGRYQGYFGAVFGAASVLGPLIGGFLVDQLSWRWVFYVNLPIGVVALVVINRVLKLEHHARRSKIDLLGSALLVAGVSLVLVAVQDAGETARITTASWAYGITGLVLIAAFVGWETRSPEPILPLRLFRNRVFAVSNSLALITGVVMFGALIFLPQYFQEVRGVSPTLSGMRLLPLLAGMLLTSIGAGQLISKTGRYKVFVVSGTAVTCGGLGLLATITVTTGAWALAAILFVVGGGLGLFMQTLVLAVQNSIPRADMGTGTSAVSFSRTLGGAIGASVLGAVMIEQERSSVPSYVARFGAQAGPLRAFTHGMDRAYLYSIPVGLVAFGLSFLLKEVRLRTTVAPDASPEPDARQAAGKAAPEPFA